MDKNVSIVKVDRRHYRVIARENWGLTQEQMKGKHVHHRIKRSDGGTDDPTNLYVCSPGFHRWCWHDGEEFVEWAIHGAKKAHEEKDEQGKSLTAKKAGKASHSHRNEEGKSLNGLRLAEIMHREKDELGRSKLAVKAAEALNKNKDELGRSINAVKGAEILNKIMHEEKNEDGKSKHAVKMGGAAHREKNEEGKSKNAAKTAERLNKEKDEEGRSLNAVKGGKTVASQIWQSTVDGFVSSAGNVARHNKANGWDPDARVRIG